MAGQVRKACGEFIVACYTAGDYAREAEERILKSVRLLNLPHIIREMPNQGSWIKNNALCQTYLRQIHDEFPDADFIYADVDAYFHSDPWPFMRTLDCDLAVYYLDGRELLSGTIFLPAGPRRRELLTRWIEMNRYRPDVWDQRHLQVLLKQDRTFRVARLPAEYCCIFDIQRRRTPKIIPVVEHFQASRRFKNRVGAKGEKIEEKGKAPLVGIVMPAYQCEAYVAKAMKSIKDQAYKNWRLAVVDDGSTDRTYVRAVEEMGEDMRISVRSIQHAGYAVAFNEALKDVLGSCDIIARQDADDWSHPSRLAKQVGRLQQGDCDLVSCGMIRVLPSGQMRGRHCRGMEPLAYVQDPQPFGPCSASIMAWKRVYERVGMFDPAFSNSADSDWNYRTLILENPRLLWAYIEEDLYYYRDHPRQMTKVLRDEGLNVHDERRSHYGPRILEILSKVKKRAIVETLDDPKIIPHGEAVREACETLGYEVIRWHRHHPLPVANVIFWWGTNIPSENIRQAQRLGMKTMYMEVGWTFDRFAHLQIDPMGNQGLASWAGESLLFEHKGPIPIRESGDLLVCLRYDGFLINTNRETGPYFIDSRAWLKHLVIASALPIRVREHYASFDKNTDRLKQFVKNWHKPNHVYWDECPDFRSATEGAKAIALVDSTAGVQALELGLPVLCYGKQVFRHPGVVYCMDRSMERTKQVTTELARGRTEIDQGAVEAMLARVRKHQWPLSEKATFATRMREEFGL